MRRPVIVSAARLPTGKFLGALKDFTAGGKLGQSLFTTIVVGISIAGTYFSGISFIALPSVTYQFGIILLIGNVLVCMPVSYLFLRYWFLPRYLAGNWKFPYDVVEDRFGSVADAHDPEVLVEEGELDHLLDRDAVVGQQDRSTHRSPQAALRRRFR